MAHVRKILITETIVHRKGLSITLAGQLQVVQTLIPVFLGHALLRLKIRVNRLKTSLLSTRVSHVKKNLSQLWMRQYVITWETSQLQVSCVSKPSSGQVFSRQMISIFS